MKRMVIVVAYFAGMLASASFACFDPTAAYSAGVVFSKGEGIATDAIERHAPDSLSYIMTCEAANCVEGKPWRCGTVEGASSDFVTIDSVWITWNTLYIDVQYSGGCRVHRFELYADTQVSAVASGTIECALSHDADGESCEAIIHERLAFNCTSLVADSAVDLRIRTPGAAQATNPVVRFRPSSGCKTNYCSFKLRSAYTKNVMAYIGLYRGGMHDPLNSLRQLVLMFDTAQEVPSAEEKAAAVIAELEHLAEIGVFALNGPQLRSIGEKLAVSPGQYWTDEDSVLPFNQWFSGINSNGVRVVEAVKGCGSGITYELPENALGTVSTGKGQSMVAPVAKSIATVRRGDGWQVTFSPVLGNNSLLRMTDIRGRLIREIPLETHARQAIIPNNNTVPGWYVISVIDKGRMIGAKAVTAGF